MKQPFRPLSRQRGAAAIELAFTLPAFAAFLFMTLFVARLLWHYTVAQKATQDAARYLSTISVQEMRQPTLAAAAAATARAIVLMEIGELNPGYIPIEFNVECDNDPCTGAYNTLPETVRVSIKMQVTAFPEVFQVDMDPLGIPIRVESIQHYVGN